MRVRLLQKYLGNTRAVSKHCSNAVTESGPAAPEDCLGKPPRASSKKYRGKEAIN